jgi:hypothetical protein
MKETGMRLSSPRFRTPHGDHLTNLTLTPDSKDALGAELRVITKRIEHQKLRLSEMRRTSSNYDETEPIFDLRPGEPHDRLDGDLQRLGHKSDALLEQLSNVASNSPESVKLVKTELRGLTSDVSIVETAISKIQADRCRQSPTLGPIHGTFLTMAPVFAPCEPPPLSDRSGNRRLFNSPKSKSRDENRVPEVSEPVAKHREQSKNPQPQPGDTSSGLKREIRALESKLIAGKEKLVKAEVELASARANNRNSRSHARAQADVDKFRNDYRGLKSSKQDLEGRLRVLKSTPEVVAPPEFGWLSGFRDFM